MSVCECLSSTFSSSRHERNCNRLRVRAAAAGCCGFFLPQISHRFANRTHYRKARVVWFSAELGTEFECARHTNMFSRHYPACDDEHVQQAVMSLKMRLNRVRCERDRGVSVSAMFSYEFYLEKRLCFFQNELLKKKDLRNKNCSKLKLNISINRFTCIYT